MTEQMASDVCFVAGLIAVVCAFCFFGFLNARR
jgi:hypothetical protein